jgi:3-deoxy-D-manno-octulosonate 8-phosphate phosphatase (KDO 8-P phosphatase)
MTNEIEIIFKNQGGEFISSLSYIQEKLNKIKAFIFDWDGVFNSGTKAEGISSSYTEADSMGTNLLRFGFWLKNQQNLPIMAIITGENNQSAKKLAVREHFHHIYFKIPNKALAFRHLLKEFNLQAHEVAFCFDDVLDFPIAKQCGLKFMVRRDASPLFKQYAIENKLCDYITAQQGGNHAVREISDLMLGLYGVLDKVISERTDFSNLYTNYLQQRNIPETKMFSVKEETVVSV